MISFKQFLAELSDKEGNDLLPIQEQIQKLCQPFLKISDGMPLYRGINNDVVAEIYRTAYVRKDRKALDSNPAASAAVDKWFDKTYGIKPRSQGLFVVGSMDMALRYGEPCYVFPIGEFQYVWGKFPAGHRRATHDNAVVVKDSIKVLANVRTQAFREYEAEHGDWLSAAQIEPYYDPAADKVLPDIDWHVNDGYKEAVEKDAELIIFCDRVILVSVPLSESGHQWAHDEEFYNELIGK